jgi:DNA primase
MSSFSKSSLELLRSRIDLVEVVGSHVQLKRTGSTFKGLCPFHEEKSPSFMIQAGEKHYHCFGCAAHGDAIQFLMTYLRMSFAEAVELLAEKFQVILEEEAGEAPKGPSKTVLKEVLEQANRFYQFYLLHTLEGHAALEYLYERGIDLPFIKRFEIGLSPKDEALFFQYVKEMKILFPLLEETGLVNKGRAFFSDRITIPIRDAVGSVIGFSSRKYKTETFGGKYINTPETPLFKKSKVLFGLSFSRKTIAKERKVLIVEGQIDALRLIDSGFDWTVAGQGTAFGEEMVKELMQLGVRHVFLALDGDTAGQEAAVKIGDLFQKEGIDVFVLKLPDRMDPDLFLREKGPEAWQKLLDGADDYLTFLVSHFSESLDIQSPAGKNELVQTIAKKIRSWTQPLMVHESLKKLAKLTHTPESILGEKEGLLPQTYVKRQDRVSFTEIDPDRILEADLLRWILMLGETNPQLLQIAEMNLKEDHFRFPSAKVLYQKYLSAWKEDRPRDLLSFSIDLELAEHKDFLSEILEKKVNLERALVCFVDTVQKILERHWMQKREEIKMKIYSGASSEEEVLALAKEFDLLKKQRPLVVQ